MDQLIRHLQAALDVRRIAGLDVAEHCVGDVAQLANAALLPPLPGDALARAGIGIAAERIGQVADN